MYEQKTTVANFLCGQKRYAIVSGIWLFVTNI